MVLKRTAIATPELIRRPESIAPDESTPETYNSVTIMLEAQLGTTPTIAERMLARIGLFKIKCAIFSSPIKWMIML